MSLFIAKASQIAYLRGILGLIIIGLIIYCNNIITYNQTGFLKNFFLF